jgi:hypothetical protein
MNDTFQVIDPRLHSTPLKALKRLERLLTHRHNLLARRMFQVYLAINHRKPSQAQP